MTEANSVALEDYLKVGLHIGTKFKTKAMSNFIYKIRGDGLAVLDIQKISDRLAIASKFLSLYSPEEIVVVCRRENGWKAVKLFSKLTGIRAFIGRYPPGVLTNTNLETFMEAKIVLVCDPQPDKNIVEDAKRLGVPLIALCDTNNELINVDLIIPCNNKGKKSLGLIFWTLTKEYLKNRGIIKNDSEMPAKLEEFIPE